MNYKRVLEGCADASVGAAVVDALGQLFQKDRKLLEKDANEPTIAARLADYLRPHFPGYDVNVEYNRMGDVPKRLAWKEKPDQVYPDIIVHVIGEPDNLLVVELKKDSNGEASDDDIRKLRAFRHDPDFLYENALFMRLGVGENAGTVSECMWVD